MSRLTFVHLSGARRGETDALERTPLSIGSDTRHDDVVVPGVEPHHANVIERDSEIVLRDGGSAGGTFLGGEPIQEAVLRDGDVFELGSGGPRLRFRQEGRTHVSLVQAMRWARPDGAPGHGDASHFFRTLFHETSSRTSRPMRAFLAAALSVTVLLFGWSQWQAHKLRQELERLRDAVRSVDEERQRLEESVEEERRRAKSDRQSLEGQIDEARAREEELNRRLAEARAGEVKAVRDELAIARDRLGALETERAVAERVIREYGPGVCLIQGSYAFYDSAGRVLRYRVDDKGRNAREPDGSLAVGIDGNGEVHTIDYFGTGFLVDRRGLILTNRHVAEPWWNDGGAEELAKQGFKARFVVFRAFFPKEEEPFELEPGRTSDDVDLALLNVELRGRKIPVLPLDRSGKGAVAGQPVMVVGYPAGLEAILAKADTEVVKELLKAHGTNSEGITEALSTRGLIRPSTTQGHIGDITRTDIVFDAPTTQGGSGGPVLNKNGQVIAVEYAVLPKFGGNSFGVPIGYALELLKTPAKSGD
jgi:S1-C subfamily serine protease